MLGAKAGRDAGATVRVALERAGKGKRVAQLHGATTACSDSSPWTHR
jgi:hypothetical protein